MKVHEKQGKSAARTNILMLFLLAWFLCFAEGRSSNCVWFTVADPWVKINKPGEYNDEMSWWGSDVYNTSSQQVPQEVLDLFLPKNRLSQVVWLGFSGVYSKEFGNPPRGKARPPSCALHWNLVVLVGKKTCIKLWNVSCFGQCLSFCHQKSLWRAHPHPCDPLHYLLKVQSGAVQPNLLPINQSHKPPFAGWVFQPCCLCKNLQSVDISPSLWPQAGKCFIFSQAMLQVLH